jgi:hypothetical protein
MPVPRCTIERLQWQDRALGSVPLPRAPLTFLESFGSGLSRRACDPPGYFWAAGDRGPNLKVKTLLSRYGATHLAALGAVSGAKVMPRLDIGPRIARLRIDGDSVALVQSFPVQGDTGRPVSGLPMPASLHTISEPAFDLDGRPIAADPSGLDPEGIAALEDGSFILSEEFGPSLVRLDADARVIARHVPQGTGLVGAGYPVHESLPAIAGKRQLNRGFEAIAVSPDQKSLFVAFQSPLAHPDEEAHKRARHVRLWRLDPATMQVLAQYLYPLDPPGSFLRDGREGDVDWGDLKVSEMVCLPGGSLLVLERASLTTKIYKVSLDESLALGPEHLERETRPTIEELSAAGGPLPQLEKQLLFSSDDAPEVSADLEGMAVLSPRELLLVNDNDFGVEGAATAFWRLTFDDPVLG